MVIYNQSELNLYVAENDINIQYVVSVEDIYNQGYQDGFRKGYQDGFDSCGDEE